MRLNEVLTFWMLSFPNQELSAAQLEECQEKIAEDPVKCLEAANASEDRELKEYRPFLATVVNELALAVLGDFEQQGSDELRMFQFDAGMAERIKEYWELLREVRFVASLQGLKANHKLQNAEAFFGRVDNRYVVVIVGDAPEEGESTFFAFVEAPELLCRLGKTEMPH